MSETQRRATKGGEFGANGEWYAGGKFINTTAENPKGQGTSHKLGKQEIAPYTWEAAPEGKRSLYRQFAGVFGKVIEGIAVFNCSEQTLQYYGKTQAEAQNLIDRWNAGERWL